jgi:hypothetical protein
MKRYETCLDARGAAAISDFGHDGNGARFLERLRSEGYSRATGPHRKERPIRAIAPPSQGKRQRGAPQRSCCERELQDDRFWHKADVKRANFNVCFDPKRTSLHKGGEHRAAPGQ